MGVHDEIIEVWLHEIRFGRSWFELGETRFWVYWLVNEVSQ